MLSLKLPSFTQTEALIPEEEFDDIVMYIP